MQQNELNELLAEMSIEEKVAELFQFPPYFINDSNATGPAIELGITNDDLKCAGSCLTITGAKKVKEVQDEHMHNHPHNIPLLFMADIINGFKTIFPVPIAQGCTFDPDLVKECASVAAKEASVGGVHVTFSPMADLVRDARWGRVMESTGEDSYLNGLMSVSMIKGYQGEDDNLFKKGKIASCLKHFAGYGASESGRDYNITEISERTLRDDYLHAYKASIDAGCSMVMTSFNTLNRIPSTGNRWLMRDVLRDEMGFDGVVISDWAAIAELINHGIASDEEEAAYLAINAGIDIDMSTSIYVKNLKKLINENKIEPALLDEAVMRVLRLKNELGLFENPYKDADESMEKDILLCQEHRDMARKCAEKSFVLLKNEDNILPLNKDSDSIAFIGPYIDNKLINGSWSFFAKDEDSITIQEAITEKFPNSNIYFKQGSTLINPGEKFVPFQIPLKEEYFDNENGLTEAVQLASKVDKVVMCLGEHRDYTGECASRSDIKIPECQMRLLREVARVNNNVCVVLFNGRPLDIRELSELSKAVIDVWFPGVEGGNAIANVLFGKSAPSGKLSMSFPYCVGQVPVYYNHMNTGRPFKGDFRESRVASKYMDIPNEPLYPFGYGLTYTSFSYSDISLNKSSISKNDNQQSITVSVKVTNTGDNIGTETVQMYIRDVSGSVVRPVRELKGFKKITLNPGQSVDVSFEINEEMLKFHDINMDYVSEPGDFEVYIGSDSTTENTAKFRLV